MEKVRKLVILAMLFAAAGRTSVMAEDPEDDDSITISMTPSVDYAVSIDQENYSFGEIELNSVYLSTDTEITVYNSPSGVVSDWKIRGSDTGDWSLGESSDEDQIQLRALLSETTVEGSEMDDAGLWEGEGLGAAAESITDTAHDLDYGYDGADGSSVAAGEEKRIWFRLDTPEGTTVSAEQNFTVTIEAWALD